MPKGSPNAQTVASEKYQKKAGYMTKGFKLKRDVAERFAEDQAVDWRKIRKVYLQCRFAAGGMLCERRGNQQEVL